MSHGPKRRGSVHRMAKRQPNPYAREPSGILGIAEAYVLQPLRWLVGSDEPSESTPQREALPPPSPHDPAISVYNTRQGREAKPPQGPPPAYTPLQQIASNVAKTPVEPLQRAPGQAGTPAHGRAPGEEAGGAATLDGEPSQAATPGPSPVDVVKVFYGTPGRTTPTVARNRVCSEREAGSAFGRLHGVNELPHSASRRVEKVSFQASPKASPSPSPRIDPAGQLPRPQARRSGSILDGVMA